MPPDPKRPENPEVLPTRPITEPTSANAPPIPTRPCLTSSQDRFPNSFKASDSFFNERTITKMLAAPSIEPAPPNLFSMARAATSSPKAPPIPTRPRLISSHCMLLNLSKALAKILQLSAKANIDKLVRNEIFVPFKTFSAAHNSIKPPPIPINPFPMSLIESSPIFPIALAKILIASATSTKDTPALIKPFDPVLFNDFDIESRVIVSIPSIKPMAVKDFSISGNLKLDILFIAAAKIPIAAAIANKDVTLIPLVKDCNVLCKESNKFVILSMILAFSSSRPVLLKIFDTNS